MCVILVRDLAVTLVCGFAAPGLRQRKLAGTEKLDGCGQQEFTWEQVAAHNTANSCWVAVNGKVYDITCKFNMHQTSASNRSLVVVGVIGDKRSSLLFWGL